MRWLRIDWRGFAHTRHWLRWPEVGFWLLWRMETTRRDMAELVDAHDLALFEREMEGVW